MVKLHENHLLKIWQYSYPTTFVSEIMYEVKANRKINTYNYLFPHQVKKYSLQWLKWWLQLHILIAHDYLKLLTGSPCLKFLIFFYFQLLREPRKIAEIQYSMFVLQSSASLKLQLVNLKLINTHARFPTQANYYGPCIKNARQIENGM